jgi:hypothetical protein
LSTRVAGPIHVHLFVFIEIDVFVAYLFHPYPK